MAKAIHSLSPRTKFAKRHYEAIALAMQDIAPSGANGEQYALWNITVDRLARLFASDNGQSKRDRFLHACEPGANVRARNGGAR